MAIANHSNQANACGDILKTFDFKHFIVYPVNYTFVTHSFGDGAGWHKGECPVDARALKLVSSTDRT